MRIHAGEVMAVLARAIGLWWLNACRIVYVVDEVEPIQRFGFAYGTLPDHAASGEERFLIEWNRADNSVWYDILSFSRARHILARLGYPMFRASRYSLAGSRQRRCCGLFVQKARDHGFFKAPPPA